MSLLPPGPKQYAELHLHLGGAVIPRILYTYVQRQRESRVDPQKQALAANYIRRFPTYERFEKRLTKPSETLGQYLEAHKIIEPLQTGDALAYFVARLLRGCYIFENLAYLELRYNPYFRLNHHEPGDIQQQMAEIVTTIHLAAQNSYKEFPVVFTQILCMDTRLPMEINRQILAVAKQMKKEVAAIDLAGPNENYREREQDLVMLLSEAKEAGLKVTAHVFETVDGCLESLLPYLDRIGHGIQIPLRQPRLLNQVAMRKQCLEICPTSYFRTGTLRSYAELKPVFAACFDLGIDVAVCTDNSALHGVRLPQEFERLLTNKVISFAEMEKCREAAFRNAFRWPGVQERKRTVS